MPDKLAELAERELWFDACEVYEKLHSSFKGSSCQEAIDGTNAVLQSDCISDNDSGNIRIFKNCVFHEPHAI